MHFAHVITFTSWPKVSQCAFHSIHMPSMMSNVLACVCCLFVFVSLLVLSHFYFASFIVYLFVFCPADHLQCRHRRGLKPLHSRTMRSIAPWRYTIPSHWRELVSTSELHNQQRLPWRDPPIGSRCRTSWRLHGKASSTIRWTTLVDRVRLVVACGTRDQCTSLNLHWCRRQCFARRTETVTSTDVVPHWYFRIQHQRARSRLEGVKRRGRSSHGTWCAHALVTNLNFFDQSRQHNASRCRTSLRAWAFRSHGSECAWAMCGRAHCPVCCCSSAQFKAVTSKMHSCRWRPIQCRKTNVVHIISWMLVSVRSSCCTLDSVEQCSVAKDRHQHEQWKSNLNITFKARGGLREYSPDMNWRHHWFAFCVFAFSSSLVLLALTRRREQGVLRHHVWQHICVGSRSGFVGYRNQSFVVHSAHFPQLWQLSDDRCSRFSWKRWLAKRLHWTWSGDVVTRLASLRARSCSKNAFSGEGERMISDYNIIHESILHACGRLNGAPQCQQRRTRTFLVRCPHSIIKCRQRSVQNRSPPLISARNWSVVKIREESSGPPGEGRWKKTIWRVSWQVEDVGHGPAVIVQTFREMLRSSFYHHSRPQDQMIDCCWTHLQWNVVIVIVYRAHIPHPWLRSEYRRSRYSWKRWLVKTVA